MILMSQQVLIPYETVKAYYASQGIALYNGDSSGQSESFFHVNWTRDGFTGRSWYFEDSLSPAHDWTEQEIQTEIDNFNNLDSMFNSWNISSTEKLEWMFKHKDTGCITE